jgi:SAM-dependent methyltransferase
LSHSPVSRSQRGCGRSAEPVSAKHLSCGVDLVLVGNLCHLFDEPSNRRLLGRLAHTLRPGGTLAILDVLADVPAADRRSLALYALELLARTGGGQIHPFTAYRPARHTGIFQVDASTRTRTAHGALTPP